MTKAELRKIIVEAVKKAAKKHNHSKTAAAYITSPMKDDVTLYINIAVKSSSVEDAETTRDNILDTLQEKYKIQPSKQD